MPVPIAMNVPKVPPPWIMTFPTLFTSSLPRNPYRSAENPPNKAPEASPTQNPIVNPVFILSKHVGCECPKLVLLGSGIMYYLIFLNAFLLQFSIFFFGKRSFSAFYKY
ncbi:hypothetical protein ACFFRR_005834 [Megaselia abdita]